MEYFFHCRDKPGTGALRKQIVETHWSFMDGYAPAFIARGPLMSDDGMQWAGSAMMNVKDSNGNALNEGDSVQII